MKEYYFLKMKYNKTIYIEQHHIDRMVSTTTWDNG